MSTSVTLTKRENQIAELIAWGASKKEVPDLLPLRPGRGPISVQTVENTVRNIYEKLNLRSKNELSAWWFCTHFHISMDLSPLRRGIIATLLLALLVSIEITTSVDFVRIKLVTTSRLWKVNRSSGRKNDTYNLTSAL